MNSTFLNRQFRFLILLLLAISPLKILSQEDKTEEKEIKKSHDFMADASLNMEKEQFINGEADYRKAIALNPKSETAKYNLGTAYYGKSKNAEAMRRFKQAATVATDKAEKHKAYHNLGNTYMNEKNYQQAVEAYKSALRNNPTDDQTRYNLALAKEMLEKNPPQDGGGNDQNKDQDKDKKDNQDKQDNKDKQDQKDKGDQKEENKVGDQDKDKGKPDEPKDKEGQQGDKPQDQQPVPGQLSPQQVKSLLEAMNNEEKKVQDKINAEKQKGAKVKTDKDW